MKWALFLFMALILIGCRGNDKTAGDIPGTEGEKSFSREGLDTTVIMPLTIGNMWVYEVSGLDTIDNTMKPVRIDTFEVRRDTIIDGERWFVVKDMTPPGGRVINREDGFWQCRRNQEPFLFLKYPASPGDEYSWDVRDITVENRVIAADTEVTVPAGTFACYRYTQLTDLQNIIVDYYFAPGAGGIRLEVFDKAGLRPLSRHDLIEIKLE
jgi:hypothetical protein